MKKLQKVLLTLVAASSVLATPSFAEDTTFYITAAGGLALGVKASKFSDDTTQYNLKAPKLGAQALLGVGYYVTDKIRTEVVFTKPWIGNSKFNEVTKVIEVIDGEEVTSYDTTTDNKMTTDINSAQLRGYFDAFDIADMGKAYIGAGIGWAQARTKFKSTENGQINSKNKNNFAWTVAVGAAFDVVEEVKLGLEYNYQDFGNAKNPIVATNKIHFRSHAVLAKLQFNI